MPVKEPKYYPKKSRRPLQAIRYFCFECMGWDRRNPVDSARPYKDVAECTDPMCPLYDFRFGKNPFSGHKGNPESLQKARMAAQRTGQNS